MTANLSEQIIAAFTGTEVSLTATEVAAFIGADQEQVQETLIRMDDSGRVVMRNGWYRLSEAEKARQSATA